MAETPDHLIERVRTNAARRVELAAAIDEDIAELVETHHISARRLARELSFGSDNTVRLAVRRYHQRQAKRTATPLLTPTESQ